MHCTICNVDVHPYQDMQPDGRMLDLCPKCNAPIAKASAVLASEGAPMQQGLDQALRSLPPRVTGTTKSGGFVFGTSGTPLTPVDAIRARLAAVEEQIPTPDQLKALRTERDQLRRALRALGVDPAPKPN